MKKTGLEINLENSVITRVSRTVMREIKYEEIR